MGDTFMNIRTRCAGCGHEQESVVTLARYARRLPALECGSCGKFTAEPTIRPYVLTLNDRRMLSKMRIAPDA